MVVVMLLLWHCGGGGWWCYCGIVCCLCDGYVATDLVACVCMCGY